MNDEQMNLLTPGSVWLKQDGKQAKVLWITNTTLSAKQQQAAPVQIVYANEEGNVYSRTLESFLKVHQFYNVDPELETRLENLIVFNEDDYEDLDDQDDEDEEDSEDEQRIFSGEELVASKLKVETDPLKNQTLAELLYHGEAEPEALPPETVQFFMTENLPSAISAEELQKALVSCSQEPNDGMNLTRHKLTFRIGGSVQLDSLKEVFFPDDTKGIVEAWAIKSEHYQEVVAWDAYTGVYPDVVYGQLYGTVIVATEQSPLVSAEEAQSHLHSGPGALMEPESQILMDKDNGPDTEIFIPQLQGVNDVSALTIEELHRQQAGPTNLIDGGLNKNFVSEILSLGQTIEVQDVTPNQ